LGLGACVWDEFEGLEGGGWVLVSLGVSGEGVLFRISLGVGGLGNVCLHDERG